MHGRCFLASGLLAHLFAVSAQEICMSANRIFTVSVDLFAGELGYFAFKECPGKVNPTIGMEVGQTYTFVQTEKSNWYHPMGFAYFPDGAHDDKDELEPTVTQTGSSCAATFACPTPRYFRNNTFLGVGGTADFGLDVYEPEFFLSLPEWAAGGERTVQLNFDDAAFDDDIFYFCHIHQFMTGRIKLLKNGNRVSSSNTPALGYRYDTITDFDAGCGTNDLDPFQTPNSDNQCPDSFVCASPTTSPNVRSYAKCIDAMNCHMMVGMTTGVTAKSPTALFLHQMIPHHQNAVNMAKSILFLEGEIECDDVTDEENMDCVLEVLLRDIVNNQNFQIQTMFGLLEEDKFDEEDDCEVLVERDLRLGDGASLPPDAKPRELRFPSDVTRLEASERRIQGGICVSPTKTFTVVVDLFAGELGYFTFKECPNLINPTIGMEIGETYTFDQSDRSNWYHPMGFAYFPDGAHDGKDELERNITLTKSNCTATATCPSPLYHRNDTFLGVSGTIDFGLDVYEPGFFENIVDWTKAGKYTVKLKFDDPTFTNDIFYFCHIHQFMTGRIKLLKSGVPVAATNSPTLPYEYDAISPFDASCGSFNLEGSKLPDSQCPNRFVCVPENAEAPLKAFSDCIDAMNCHMMKGMTTAVSSDSRSAIFLQQMIPHHQNAVNMAKALLHETGEVVCSDLTDEEAPDCILEVVLRDIVNVQNAQIQTMRAILADKNLPEVDDCPVEVESVPEDQCPDDDSCRMWLLFNGKRVHRQFLGLCIGTCTALPIGIYLNMGWECGRCE